MSESYFVGQCIRLQDLWPKDYDENRYLSMTIDIKTLEDAWKYQKQSPLFGTIAYFYFQNLAWPMDKLFEAGLGEVVYKPILFDDGFYEGSFNDKGKK